MRFNKKLTSGLILILFSISAISLLYIFIFSRNRSLSLTMEAPDSVLSGVPFELKVNFSNNSGAVLSDVRLTLSLPDGVSFFGQNPRKTLDNKSLGNVGVGSLIQESYKLIMFSPEMAAKKIKAAINYAPVSLGARFEKSETSEIKVRTSGVELQFSLPETITSGEEFPIDVAYRNISDQDFSNLELKFEYPANFSYSKSSLRPDSGNNLWILGDLRSNSEGKLTVTGSALGAEGDALEFKTFLSRQASGYHYPVSENSVKTTIGASPVSLNIRLNDSGEYITKPGETLNYLVSYINRTDAPLTNLVIKAKLIGEMFDLNSVQTAGFFRASDNTLIWNSANIPNLIAVLPGTAGAISFSVKVKENYPIRRFSDKNFSLRTQAESEANGKIVSKTQLETKVSGNVGVDAKAYFRDADSGFLNSGPFPPKVGQVTNFTIHWLLKSFASDINNIEVRAPLSNNVKMVGEPKSNSGLPPFYDSLSNEMVWKVDKIAANQGVISSPIEAIFQVEAVPPEASIGNHLPIFGNTTVKAIDGFTNQELTAADFAITTALPDDPTISQPAGVVQP